MTAINTFSYAIIHNDNIPLLLNVKIAGKECFAIVDTGAQASFINNDFVEENCLPVGQYTYMALSGIGFRPDMQSNHFTATIELRDNDRTNHKYRFDCSTMDLSGIRSTFKDKGYEDVVLILGADWLKTVRAVIDVRERKLMITANEVIPE